MSLSKLRRSRWSRSKQNRKWVLWYPIHVVCEWLGNSQPVATKHYLQVTDEHFARGAESDVLSTQNQAQQGGELGRTEMHEQNGEEKTIAVSQREFRTSQDSSVPCTEPAKEFKGILVGDTGLEPATSTMSTLRSNQLS
jgi:hypothetical protein